MPNPSKPDLAERQSFVFKIGYEGKPDKAIETTAYLFDRRGSVIATSQLKDGQAEFKVSEDEIKRARLMFGPTLQKDRVGARKPTAEMMGRLQVYEPAWHFRRETRVYELLPIPEMLWKWWLWCRCRVRGQVLKTVNTGGATYEVPVCNARVHVCEVDRLLWVIPRLPDREILRLRDDLLRLLEWRHPLPWPPEPDPEVFSVPETLPVPPGPDPVNRLDPGMMAPVMMEARQFARARQIVGSVRQMAMLGPQPEPPDQPVPFMGEAALSPAIRAALSSSSAMIVRDALMANVELLRPWLCMLDWLWPYFYRCDEVAVIMTDAHGRFEADVWYLCLGDHPDLYFWVEYPIDGVWETVYHPSVRCHTYWNYVCGSEVTIRVTDPRVPGCWDHPVLPGKKLVVKSIGPDVSMSDINRASVPAEAPYEGTGKPGEVSHPWSFPEWGTKEVAFGDVLEPRVDFGSGLKPAGITHYLWSYRWLGSADDADWRPIDAEVRRHYRVATPPGDPIKYSSVKLGPDADGVFQIDPALPGDGEDWEVLNEHYDLASAHFNSKAAVWSPGVVGYGKFELKLELFRKVGGALQRVDLTAEAIDLAETTSHAPFLADEIFTAIPSSDRVLTEIVGGAPHVVAYRLVLHVENRVCFGTINDVTVSGIGAGPCGFLEYDPEAEPAPSAVISFRASHPANFAAFNFRTTRVTTHLPSASVHGLVQVAAVNGFNRVGDTFSKLVSVDTLLHELEGGTSCVRAAFAETLYVYALVTNGYHRLWELDAPRPYWEDPSQIDVRAFALTPEEPAL